MADWTDAARADWLSFQFLIVRANSDALSASRLERAQKLLHDLACRVITLEEYSDTALSQEPSTLVAVCDPFEGGVFHSLAERKCIIVGPQIIFQQYRAKQRLFPKGAPATPLFNSAMARVIACCTALDSQTRISVHARIEYMGGQVSRSLTSKVTHVIAASGGPRRSEKYKVAVKLAMPIMSQQWVDAVWAANQEMTVDADDARFSGLRLPVFNGCIVSVTGLALTRRQFIESKVNEFGGRFSSHLDDTCTHLVSLPSNAPEFEVSQKMLLAQRLGIFIVTYEWITNSLDFGACCDETSFLVELPDLARAEAADSRWARTNSMDSTGSSTTGISGMGGNTGAGTLPRGRHTLLDAAAENTADVDEIIVSDMGDSFPPWAETLEEQRLFADPGSVKATSWSFFDGCRVFFWGLSDRRLRHAKQVLLLAGGIRVDTLSSLVTHVVVGACPDSRLFDAVDALPTRPAVVGVCWIFQSYVSGTAVSCDHFLVGPDASQHHTGSSVSSAPTNNAAAKAVAAPAQRQIKPLQFQRGPAALAVAAGFSEVDFVNIYSKTPRKATATAAPADDKRQARPSKGAADPRTGPLFRISVCVSQYEGSERADIERLVKDLGGVFSEKFFRKTAVLICATPSGPKYEKALEWRVPVVTSAWLQDCFRTGNLQPFSLYSLAGSAEAPEDAKVLPDIDLATDGLGSDEDLISVSQQVRPRPLALPAAPALAAGEDAKSMGSSTSARLELTAKNILPLSNSQQAFGAQLDYSPNEASAAPRSKPGRKPGRKPAGRAAKNSQNDEGSPSSQPGSQHGSQQTRYTPLVIMLKDDSAPASSSSQQQPEPTPAPPPAPAAVARRVTRSTLAALPATPASLGAKSVASTAPTASTASTASTATTEEATHVSSAEAEAAPDARVAAKTPLLPESESSKPVGQDSNGSGSSGSGGATAPSPSAEEVTKALERLQSISSSAPSTSSALTRRRRRVNLSLASKSKDDHEPSLLGGGGPSASGMPVTDESSNDVDYGSNHSAEMDAGGDAAGDPAGGARAAPTPLASRMDGHRFARPTTPQPNMERAGSASGGTKFARADSDGSSSVRRSFSMVGAGATANSGNHAGSSAGGGSNGGGLSKHDLSQEETVTYEDSSSKAERERILARIRTRLAGKPVSGSEAPAGTCPENADEGAVHGSRNEPQRLLSAHERLVPLSAAAPVPPAELSTPDSAVLADNSSTRLRSKKFLLSALNTDRKAEYSSIIERLGGSVFDTQYFAPSCTHVVVGSPSRSEKYMAACAMGKWVLKPSYLDASFAAGHFVDEADHEWCADDAADEAAIPLVSACRKWRLFLDRERNVLGAFHGWQVMLCVCKERQGGFKRLLEAGGARVVSSRPPYCHALPDGTVRPVVPATHAFIEPSQTLCDVSELERLASAGVECLRPEYIADFLMHESTLFEDYRVFATPAVQQQQQQQQAAPVQKKRLASAAMADATARKRIAAK